jgi:hypothetical protein
MASSPINKLANDYNVFPREQNLRRNRRNEQTMREQIKSTPRLLFTQLLMNRNITEHRSEIKIPQNFNRRSMLF